MNWLDRFFPKTPVSRGPAVGIGMLVAVVSDAQQADAWEDDPVGVVVAPGNKELAPYPGLQLPRYWTVAFERPSYTGDGRGPFERATFPEARLRVLDPGPTAED
jgi:hypothetical protein